MASGVRLLLRLPPAIRQQILSSELSWSNNCICRASQQVRAESIGFYQTRSFTLTSHLAKNKQNVFKNAQPQKPTPQAHNLPKPVPPPRKSVGSAPPAPESFSPRPSTDAAPRPSRYLDWISSRFPNTQRVLLYVAPDHGGFFAISFFAGFVFLVGGYTFAQTFLKDEEGLPAKPWFTKLLGAVPTLGLIILGTTFCLAPLKIIKSITLVPASGASTVAQNSMLRLEIKRALPFTKPDIMEIAPEKFFLDRNVPGAMYDIKFTNYALKDASGFAEYYFSGAMNKKQDGAFTRFNRGLLNLWPNLVKNTKRMFLRDQIAYVRVTGNGNFKLDLQGSHLLDGGNLLARVAKEDVNVERGIGAFLRKIAT